MTQKDRILVSFQRYVSLLSCFPPLWVVFVHQSVKAGIMAWFQEVAQFMNHHMLNTPIGQQKQVNGKADAMAFVFAHAPT